MSKAILVIDMPKDCHDCELQDFTCYGMDKYHEWGDPSEMEIENKRPSWCPLKEIDDEVPVRHGHWINHYDDLFPEESTQECSVCHAEQMVTMLDNNYCPHCGAKMEKEEE